MKKLITPNLLKFTFIAILLTLVFRFALSTSITNKTIIFVILSALFYAILMWFNGRYFGRKEYENLPIFDIGFRFHLSTFVIHNFISILWFAFGLESKYENINIIYLIASIWSLLLLIHFIYFLSMKKYSIKDLDKEDLFE